MSDATGFDAFYAANASRLTRDIYLATGDLGRAQDAVQEAFLRGWRRWDTIHAHDCDPAAWVYTVAWRLAVSDWRRVVRQGRLLVRLGHDTATDVPGPSPNVVAVRDALATLPRDQRVAIVLYHLRDLPIAEIAAVLGVPEGTVKARLSRGRAALKPLLSDDPALAEPEDTPWTTT